MPQKKRKEIVTANYKDDKTWLKKTLNYKPLLRFLTWFLQKAFT